MFEKQGWHYFFLVILLVGVAFVAQGDTVSGELWGISSQAWLWIAIAVPIVHQIFVWLFSIPMLAPVSPLPLWEDSKILQGTDKFLPWFFILHCRHIALCSLP